MRNNKTILTAILAVVFAVVAAMPAMAQQAQAIPEMELDAAIVQLTKVITDKQFGSAKVLLMSFGSKSEALRDYVTSGMGKALANDKRVNVQLMSYEEEDAFARERWHVTGGNLGNRRYTVIGQERGATYVFCSRVLTEKDGSCSFSGELIHVLELIAGIDAKTSVTGKIPIKDTDQFSKLLTGMTIAEKKAKEETMAMVKQAETDGLEIDPAIQLAAKTIADRMVSTGGSVVLTRFNTKSNALNNYVLAEIAKALEGNDKVQVVNREKTDSVLGKRFTSTVAYRDSVKLRALGNEFDASYVFIGTMDKRKGINFFIFSVFNVKQYESPDVTTYQIPINENIQLVQLLTGKNDAEAQIALVDTGGTVTAAERLAAKNDEKQWTVTPAFMSAWYPASFEIDPGKKAEHHIGIENYVLALTMDLKFFKDFGATLNLNIDDPTFSKVVDIAGKLNFKAMLLNFSFHTLSGSVKWLGDDNPIYGNDGNFRETWNTVSLLCNFAYVFDWDGIYAFGISYTTLAMPIAYRINDYGAGKDHLTKDGFGYLRGGSWGFTFFIDTMTASMQPKALPGWDIWMYLDLHLGIIGLLKLDEEAVKRMEAANNSTIKRKIDGLGGGDDGGGGAFYSKLDGILGAMYRWDFKFVSIGLAFGVNVLWDSISGTNEDLFINFAPMHIGPALRFSARF